jgi:hypothetical protein
VLGASSGHVSIYSLGGTLWSCHVAWGEGRQPDKLDGGGGSWRRGDRFGARGKDERGYGREKKV